MLSNITVSPSPHFRQPLTTRRIMIDVIVGLVPAIIMAGYYFRIYALVLIPTCILSAVITEWLCNLIRKTPSTLGDYSAVITGIILALSVPPTLPVWAAIIGASFSIVIGKMVFGGLGCNIFNPAMVGRAFLTASFGMVMTTWTVPATVDSTMSKIGPDNQLSVVTQATPLAMSKDAAKAKTGAEQVNGQLKAMLWGEVGGCLGETSVIAILAGGLYLVVRRTISVHIPLAILLSAFLFAGIANLINPEAYMSPFAHLAGGGILLGAIFIATDPCTAPLTRRGKWIFGAGVGAITVMIRIFGGYPGGVMYSVLLMNGLTPLIDRLCKRIPAGGKPHA